MPSLIIKFCVFVLSDTNCNKIFCVKNLLPYPELTCQLMRVDKFSTVIRQGVLTGGPYLALAQTNPIRIFFSVYFKEWLEGLNKETEMPRVAEGISYLMYSMFKSGFSKQIN